MRSWRRWSASGKQVFLDYKLYDIGETVRAGVAAIAARGARFLTVHGDPHILAAAVEGAAGSALGILAVTVLTSLDDAALQTMGYRDSVHSLVQQRAREAAAAGCAGIIACRGGRSGSMRLQAPGGRIWWS